MNEARERAKEVAEEIFEKIVDGIEGMHPGQPLKWTFAQEGIAEALITFSAEQGKELAEELQDWRDGQKQTMAEECRESDDRKHCTCVPNLRRDVKYWKELCHSRAEFQSKQYDKIKELEQKLAESERKSNPTVDGVHWSDFLKKVQIELEETKQKLAEAENGLREVIKAHKGIEVAPRDNDVPAQIRMNGAIKKAKAILQRPSEGLEGKEPQ